MASGGAVRAGKAEILLSLRDTTGAGLRQAERSLTNFAAKTAKIGLALGAVAAAPLAGFALSVKEFGRIEQLFGRFASVFKSLSAEATSFSDNLARSINQSTLVIQDQLAQFQAFLQGLGFDASQAFDFSKTLVTAAQDITAFDDTITDSQEAVEVLLSSLAGQTRPIRKYGADIQDAVIQQELLASGARKVGGEFSQLDKVIPRVTITMRALSRSGITGQAVKEVNTLQSRIRGLGASFLDLKVALGQVLSNAGIPGYVGEVTNALRGTAEWIKRNETLVQTLGKVTIAATATSAALLAISAVPTVAGGALGLFGGLSEATRRRATARLAAQTAVPSAVGATVGAPFSGVNQKQLLEEFRLLRTKGIPASAALQQARGAAVQPSRFIGAGAGAAGSALAAAGAGFSVGTIALVTVAFAALAVATFKVTKAIHDLQDEELKKLKENAEEAKTAIETTTKAIENLGGVLTVQRPEAALGLKEVAQAAEAELAILERQIEDTDKEFQKAFIGGAKADELRERLAKLNARLDETREIASTVATELEAIGAAQQSLARERFETTVSAGRLGEVQTPIAEQRRLAETFGRQQRKNFAEAKRQIDALRASLSEEDALPLPAGFAIEEAKRLFQSFDAGTLLEGETAQLLDFVRQIQQLRIQRSLTEQVSPSEGLFKKIELGTATREDLDQLAGEAREFQTAFDPFARLREREQELSRFGGFLSDFARSNALKQIRDDFEQSFAPTIFSELEAARRELDPLLDIRQELQGRGLQRFLPELEELERFRKQQPRSLPSQGTFFGGFASRIFTQGTDTDKKQLDEQKKTVAVLGDIHRAIIEQEQLRFR